MKQIIVGVDTHKSTHVAVAIDDQGSWSRNSEHPGDGGRLRRNWQRGRGLSARSGPSASRARDLSAPACPGPCEPEGMRHRRRAPTPSECS